MAFPRPCLDRSLLVSLTGRLNLSGQLVPGQVLAYDLPHGQIKSLAVVQALALVVAPRLLIEVPEQVEGLNRNVRAFQSAFEQAPKVFQPVGVDFAAFAGAVFMAALLTAAFFVATGFGFAAAAFFAA